MDSAAFAILVTLIAYKVALLGLGLWAQRRTVDTTDFYLGGRHLGAWVAAISASASSSSVWTLLGLSGFAYRSGLSALWMIPSCCGGFLINWYFIAPRMLRQRGDAMTLPDWLAGPPGTPGRRNLLLLSSVVILVSFLVYVANQFGGAGTTFEEAFELDRTRAVLIGGAVVMVYTLLGGFWAVSLTDTLQGLMMAAVAVLLPLAALIHIGGPVGLVDGLGAIDAPGYLSLTSTWEGPAAFGFVLGLLGVGIGYPGQPHVINRFMALRDPRALRHGRRIAITWAVLTYSGMVLLGLCGRVFLQLDDGQHEHVFQDATTTLFPPVVAGIVTAAVLSAIMSTADSQLLVCASSVTEDLGLGKRLSPRASLAVSRLTVFALCVVAVGIALELPKEIFKNVLFAWSALGAAFGPLLVVRLVRGPVAPAYGLLAMGSGFGLAGLAYLLHANGVSSGTSVEERVVPYLFASLFAWLGSTPRAGRVQP